MFLYYSLDRSSVASEASVGSVSKEASLGSVSKEASVGSVSSVASEGNEAELQPIKQTGRLARQMKKVKAFFVKRRRA